jgi:hypothetical protein
VNRYVFKTARAVGLKWQVIYLRWVTIISRAEYELESHWMRPSAVALLRTNGPANSAVPPNYVSEEMHA